jgi:hypothetical protein
MSRNAPLDVIQVREPCHESWEAMTGDDKTRFCAGCQRHVHNLSAMLREEAERLVCESAGRLCVRYEAGAGGAPVTLEYQKTGRIRGGWRLWTAVGALGACVAGVVQAMVREKPPVPVAAPVLGKMLMGDIAVRPPLPPPPTTQMVMGKICPATPSPRPAPSGGTAAAPDSE